MCTSSVHHILKLFKQNRKGFKESFKQSVISSFHISIHNCTLSLLFLAQIFGLSVCNLRYSCVSRDHNQLSQGAQSSEFSCMPTQFLLYYFRQKSVRCATSNSNKDLGVCICHTLHTGGLSQHIINIKTISKCGILKS